MITCSLTSCSPLCSVVDRYEVVQSSWPLGHIKRLKKIYSDETQAGPRFSTPQVERQIHVCVSNWPYELVSHNHHGVCMTDDDTCTTGLVGLMYCDLDIIAVVDNSNDDQDVLMTLGRMQNGAGEQDAWMQSSAGYCAENTQMVSEWQAYILNVQNGGDASKRTTCASSVEGYWQRQSAGGSLAGYNVLERGVVNVEYEITSRTTICPSATATAGIALGFTGLIELIMTVVVVFSLLSCGAIEDTEAVGKGLAPKLKGAVKTAQHEEVPGYVKELQRELAELKAAQKKQVVSA